MFLSRQVMLLSRYGTGTIGIQVKLRCLDGKGGKRRGKQNLEG